MHIHWYKCQFQHEKQLLTMTRPRSSKRHRSSKKGDKSWTKSCRKSKRLKVFSSPYNSQREETSHELNTVYRVTSLFRCVLHWIIHPSVNREVLWSQIKLEYNFYNQRTTRFIELFSNSTQMFEHKHGRKI